MIAAVMFFCAVELSGPCDWSVGPPHFPARQECEEIIDEAMRKQDTIEHIKARLAQQGYEGYYIANIECMSKPQYDEVIENGLEQRYRDLRSSYKGDPEDSTN